jgi:hypothetical protein
MEFLAKAAYYAGTVVSGWSSRFFSLPACSGRVRTAVVCGSRRSSWWRALRGMGCCTWRSGFGHRQHRWLTGLALALAALATAGALMIFGLLVFGKVHWQ